MIRPVFKIGLIDAQTDRVIHSAYFFETFDQDLAEALIQALKHEDIGLLAGRTKVETAIRDAMARVITELKQKSIFAVNR